MPPSLIIIAALVLSAVSLILKLAGARRQRSDSRLPAAENKAEPSALPSSAPGAELSIDSRMPTAVNVEKAKIQDEAEQASQKLGAKAPNLQQQLAQKQKLIEESYDRTKLLLENIGVGIIMTDGLGEIRFCGLQTSRLTGYSRSELAGKNLASLFADKTISFADLLTRVFPARLLCTAKNGDAYWVDLWLSQIMLDGRPSYVVSLADASEAVEAEKRRQELIAQITHELRSPLTSIYASLTMLSKDEGRAPAEVQSLVAICTRNAQSMKFTIDEILDYAKIEAGKLTIELRSENLQGIVNGALESVRSLAEGKALKLQVSISPMVVLVDARRITQVLINLLSNGVKHCPRGKTISVYAMRHDDWVEIIVSDQGAGVSDEEKKNLFASFSQGATARAIPDSSSGLGLAFCKEIISLHKGSIWVTDGQEGGAAFHFTVPIV